MPDSKPTHSSIRDNCARGKAGDFVEEHLSSNTSFSVVSAYFTIHAYHALKEKLDGIQRLRFLFGDPQFVNSIDKDSKESREFSLSESGLKLGNQLQQGKLARECAEWIEDKAEIRTVTQSGLLHGKLYHLRNGEVDHAMLGSSNFTVPGLGLREKGNNVELNMLVEDNRDRRDLLNWFDEWWNNQDLTEDCKDKVLQELARLYSDQSPEFIYYLTLFHIFREFIDGERNAEADLTKVQLPDTRIWRALYGFQKDGAKTAINKIRDLNGCILADSVGLGKTYTALAVIKYFELKNQTALVLCPKKLSRNWTVYRSNDLLNPFAGDQFNYDVLHHTDLSRDSGEVNGINLGTLNWGTYDLIVIDESHNFRNNAKAKQEEGEPRKRTRYERLIEDIITSGSKTKVLLLSATPVNNELSDLRNQVSFIAGGDVANDAKPDAAFRESLKIDSIKETTRKAQQHFTKWAKQPAETRSSRDLLQAIGGDFFKLLDGLSIARSRKQISRYYKDEMKRLGGFPQRPRPLSLHPPIDLRPGQISFEELDHDITELTLSLYHPTSHLRKDLPEAIRKSYIDERMAGFTQEGRERILIGMMKVNFLKRLESSIDSFRLTLERTIEKIDRLEKRFTAFESFTEQNTEIDYDVLEPEIEDDDEFDSAEFMVGGKRKFHLGHIDIPKWRKAVQQDRVQLKYLLDRAHATKPSHDGKLAKLREQIFEKLDHPTTNKEGKRNRKILIFTAFADTAKYLYDQLVKEWQGRPAPGSVLTPGRAAPATFFQPFNPLEAVEVTRQDLPHWRQAGATYFVTYRLADSLPMEVLLPWRESLDQWIRENPKPWDEATLSEYEEIFRRKEEALDAGHGECWLRQSEIRKVIEENLRYYDGERYILDRFVVMPNHVHVLVKPLNDYRLSDILHTWKSYTAKAINRLLDRKGEVWQGESFDHIVRNRESLERFRHYIDNNPKNFPDIRSQQGIGLTEPEHSWQGRPAPVPSHYQGQAACESAQVQEQAAPGSAHPQGHAAPATVHFALVTGSKENRSTLSFSNDFDDILTNFSPIAKRRAEQPRFPQDEEIDVLIATDCISEGQNLQDCDLLINYDIHWNPVRIIQRFGRIDRIGSLNESVRLVNFWPVADLDRYLNVKHRVEARMALVDLSATQEENLLENEQVEELISRDLLFRNQQLKCMQSEILDLEDFEDNITLADFSLDEFRIDLLQFLESRRAELEAAKPGLYAVVPTKPDQPIGRPGAIFCLRHRVEQASLPASGSRDSETAKKINPLGRCYLIYVHDDGTVRITFTQPKQALNLFRDLAAGLPEAQRKLCDLFDACTDGGADMSHYDTLVKKCLESIAHTFTRRAAASLFSGRDGKLPTVAETPKELETEYELLTWLVILENE